MTNLTQYIILPGLSEVNLKPPTVKANNSYLVPKGNQLKSDYLATLCSWPAQGPSDAYISCSCPAPGGARYKEPHFKLDRWAGVYMRLPYDPPSFYIILIFWTM